jgi:transcriptional regulator with XRE-family HTH domain
MTQDELAEKAQLSLSVVKKIEQGHSARMDTYHQLARALGVETIKLMVSASPQPVEQSVDDTVLAEMRSAINPPIALNGRPIYGTADGDHADLRSLSKAVASVATAYHADRYDDLADLLPALVRSAHHHVDAYDTGNDRREALRLRADITGLAGRYLIQIRAHDLALNALHASLRDALEIEHIPLAAAAVSGQAHAMLRQGRLGEVEDLCSSAADELEPKVSTATENELAAWGWMLLRASAAAARNNRPEEARDYLKVARAAAAPLPQEHQTVDYKTFGQLTVALKGPENAMIADQPDRALELSEELPRHTGKTKPEEWDRHQLDVAQAHVRTGNADRATEILTTIRKQHPAWLRYQQPARDTVRTILSTRPRMPSNEQRQLANFLDIQD